MLGLVPLPLCRLLSCMDGKSVFRLVRHNTWLGPVVLCCLQGLLAASGHLGVVLWALLVVSTTVALLCRLFCIYSYSGLAHRHLTLLLRGTLLTALHCIDRDGGSSGHRNCCSFWVDSHKAVSACCRVFFQVLVLVAVDETFLPGKCWKVVFSCCYKCGRFAGECVFSQSCFWQRGGECLCAMVLCTATYLCYFSGNCSVSQSSSLTGFTAIFQLSLVLCIETVIAKSCWCFYFEIAVVVVLKCHFCVNFVSSSKVSSFQIFSFLTDTKLSSLVFSSLTPCNIIKWWWSLILYLVACPFISSSTYSIVQLMNESRITCMTKVCCAYIVQNLLAATSTASAKEMTGSAACYAGTML